MSNAVKHHPGPAGRVRVGAERRDGHWLFSVADDGAGIPQEYAARIFQMFQTLQPRDETEGSGMGLAIVSRLIDWQRGHIWHEPADAPGGTVFRFEWKIVDAESAESLLDTEPNQGSRAA
jgi:signal transduction histidine kinase